MKNPKNKFNKGFTLIELLTAVAIFSIVIVISMGSMLGIFDANRKARSLKNLISNLNPALESMSKELRYGYTYHCGEAGSAGEAQNCPGGDTYISFMSSEGVQTYFRLNSGAIEKKRDSENFVPITAPEVVVDSLYFYVTGAGTVDNTLQPKINILLKGHSGSGDSLSSVTLQTLVSQRNLDIDDPNEPPPPPPPPPPPAMVAIDYLIVGGGGGGGNGPSGGGGGGGDVVIGSQSVADNQGIAITIGGGGSPGTIGLSTSFGSITALGGGAGATTGAGGAGANGGGGVPNNAGGSGNAGFAGGSGLVDTSGNSNYGGGGGGGDTQAGGNAWASGPSTQAGLGGAGRTSNYGGTGNVVYGSGGGGGSNAYTAPAAGGSGAGTGGRADAASGTSGSANRGGGGGGAGVNYTVNPVGAGSGGSGGSGIVIIRYRKTDHSGATGGDISEQGVYTIHTFTSSGTFTP